jgi:hypothetical protein
MSFIDEEGIRDVARRQDELRFRQLDARRTAPPDTDHLAEIRDRFDSAYKALDTRGAPDPMPNEGGFSYRRRLASGLQPYSPSFKDSNFYKFDVDLTDKVEPELVREATATALALPGPNGSLRAVRSKSDSGHDVTRYVGSPLSWMSRFMGSGKTVRQFQHQNGTPIHANRRTIRFT